MPIPDGLTLYHCPHTRSSGVLMLLEELGAPYRLEVMDMHAGENRRPGYLAINPMGKVPAIAHRGAVVTEQVAIYLYLADEFASAGLAPPIGDPLRGPYLRWLVFYGSCFEPAIVDRFMQREPGPQGSSPYGDFASTTGAILSQVERGPWLLGERYSAADLLWGTALGWITGFKLLEPTPAVSAYIERVQSRPAVAKARTLDDELAAKQAAARGSAGAN